MLRKSVSSLSECPWLPSNVTMQELLQEMSTPGMAQQINTCIVISLAGDNRFQNQTLEKVAISGQTSTKGARRQDLLTD
jgi:hypothetical protein